ncbi:MULTISPECIES: hypothetical protein [Paraburkholderia]|jgi:hypothetical protein|uniref:Uncharacterized protein n=1 Tax=Paraburkholderia madseniana TaxID=2599607 RepID=A0AAP5BBR7_9BURK|nr:MULTISPECIES: hypothetical protein [Paraburkholderia]MCX4145197.1 hypothetical protein [Paraburkholderia madseniana]MDN7148147.1 hypothetical protein [Paraburkholderia sp. WS6]MDQ6407027.1 hypothetical protein [Paraburkholderia madseniana]
MPVHSAAGTMTLMSETEAPSEREIRALRLEASIDGKAVVLTDIDRRTPGIRREVRYQMTVTEFIAAICAQRTPSIVEFPDQ